MKYKKIMFMLVLAVFLLSIAGVCASDTNDTAMVSQDDTAMESTDMNVKTVEDSEPVINAAEDGEILSASADDEIVGVENDLDELSANPGTYSGLSSEIGSGGNIALTHDYYTYDSGSTIVISIDNSVIDGKGAIIDMAGSNMRAFNVTASGVTIKNLTIQNGNVSDNGGAVYFNNTGVVENCNFVNNNVSNLFGKGGAVYFNGTGNVINCNFTDNYGGYGGAVYFSTNGDVSGCSFVNNTAIISGGAVLIKKGGVITDCNFTNNFAVDGSAILIDGEGIVENCIFVNNSVGSAVFIEEEGKLENCIFVNNSAEQYGGAVILDSSGTIQNCNFTNNSAGLYGGAIYIEVYGIVENCIFVNNNATRYGGAICFYEEGDVTDCIFVNNSANVGGALLIFENADVTNCNFTNNAASSRAGAVYFNMGGEVTDCIFTNNSAESNGGAVWFTYEGIVENCIFVNNNAAQDGGAVYFYSDSEVNNCNFTNNNATRYGGAVYFYSAGEVNNCNFTNNNAEYGGAIDFDDDATVENCIFTNNSGKYGGAVFFYTAGDVTNCNFTNNSAGLYGGAVYINKNGIVENCNFNGNNASNGGAIRLYMGGIVTSCNFNGNNASNGSAIWLNGTDSLVSGCSFVNNSKYSIYFYNDENMYHNLSINDNIFLNNTGVAIYFVNNDSSSNADYNWFGNNATNYNKAPETNNVEISTWLFLNATVNPDAITTFDSSDIVFKLYAYAPSGVSEYDSNRLKKVNLTLTPTNGRVNTTWTYLGETVNFTPESFGIGTLTASIENASYTTTLKISDGTTFRDLNNLINRNDNDTIILDRNYTYNPTFDYNLKGGVVIDRAVTIIGNGHTLNALGQARIFDIQSADVTIKNITLINAEKNASGAAIMWTGARGIISDCVFVNNSATRYGAGGAILWRSIGGKIFDCSFVNNSAISGGGAISWDVNGGVISGCSFVNNSAIDAGGAICREANGGVVSECSFVNNSAEDGGAIYWKHDNGNVSACIFVNNTGDYGIIHFHNDYGSKNLSLNNNIFLNNNGAAIYFVNNDSTSNADYNWFGNTKDDCNARPATDNVDIGIWLFLDAKSNPDIFPISTASEITFKLYAYDSNEVFEYDNSRLKLVNLTITPVNGQVNATNVEPAKTILYTESGAGSDNLTASIENVSWTVTLKIADGTTFWDLNNLINASSSDTVTLDRNYAYNPITDYDFKDGIIINRMVTIIGGDYSIDAKGQARIFNIHADKVTIRNVTFINANATDYGGALYWNGVNVTVFDCLFVNNSAGISGGAIYWRDGADTNVSGCIFVNNTAENGGAVTVGDGVVSGCSFVNNSAEYGGAVILAGGTLSGCSFVNNSAYNCGAVSLEDGTVSGCSFVNNTADNDGGAIVWSTTVWSSNRGYVFDCSFENNRAGSDGGAILWLNGANGVVSDCIFVNNSASDEGGAILWSHNDNANISGCSFANNTAGSDGGAIYLKFSANGVVYDCSFVNNSARYGGAIEWQQSDNGNISTCIFVNNSDERAVIFFYNMGSGHGLSINNNIFLNNNASAISFILPDSSSNADYNWFGHNATDYETQPATSNVAINNWLFLNATATPDSILIFQSSDIIFRLYSYSESEGVSYYDNAKLPAVNLTLKATKGDTVGIAKFDELIRYFAMDFGTGTVTGEIENVQYTIEITHEKADLNLSVETSQVIYSNNTTIALSYNPNATGKVNITLKGKRLEYTFADLDLNATISLGIVGADEYDVIVEYSGDDLFANATANGTLKVNKANSTLTVSDIEFDYNDMGSGEISFTNAIGVDAQVIGHDEAMIFIKGNTITVLNLTAGSYNMTVTTVTDANHSAVSENATITVRKVNSTINVNDIVIYYGESVNVTVATDGATGITAESDVDVEVNGNVITIPANLESGNHTVTITTVPDDNHIATNKVVNIVDCRPDNNVIVIVDGKEYPAKIIDGVVVIDTGSGQIKENTTIGLEVSIVENNATFTVNVDPDAAGIVRFEVSGAEEYIVYADVLNGVAVMNDVLKSGDYTIVATYMGDSKFNSNSTVKSFAIYDRIKRNTTVTSSVVVDANTVTITASVDIHATGFVEFNITGKKYYAPVGDGKAILVDDFLAGTYNVDVAYLGDEYFNGNSTSVAFNVSEPESNITVVVDGKEYNATVDNGTITVETDMPTALEEANQKIENLTDALDEANKTIENLTGELADAQANATELTKDLADANAKVENLTDALVDAQANATELTKDLADASANVENLTGELVDAQANATKLAGELVDTNKRIDDLTHQLEEALANKTKSVVVDGVEYPIEYVNGTTVVNTNKTEPVKEVSNATIIAPGDVKAGETTNVTVNIPGVNGNVSIIVDGKETVVELVNGSAVVPMENIAEGNHDVVVIYSGDETHAPTHSVSTFSVPTEVVVESRLATKFNVTEGQSIGTYAVDYPAGERGTTYQFQLTDSNGDPIVNATVQFAYKTVILNRTTDENGIVLLGVSTQFADSYLCALSYLGDEKHNATFVAFNFKLDKKPLTISAKAKTFKSSVKTKKYTITLKTTKCASKDGKVYLKSGKKVTLKVNGKTYTAKINSKGQATFKITKLTKKGKYTAVVKFTGDNTYKSVSKNVKITIK